MRLAALILAAGRSTRMGANKLLELLQEKPLVRHVADAACASHASPLIIVTGHEREKLSATLSEISATFVDNPLYAEGLSTSLKAGLAAIPQDCDGAVILLGDMPLVTPDIINALIAAAPRVSSKIAAVPVYNGEWGNPVLLMRAAFADVSLLAGDAGARKYLSSHRARVVEVPVEDQAILLDLDTPEALARARMAP
jgi:molybdenum cofactor cytidylyltransferase